MRPRVAPFTRMATNDVSCLIPGKRLGLPGLIHVSRAHSHVASRVTWHSHEGFEVLFLLDGATTYEFSDQPPVELRGGHFLVVPPGVVHRGSHNVRSPSTICGLALKASGRGACRNTTFGAQDMRVIRQALEGASRKVHPFGASLRWLVRHLMEEAVRFSTQPEAESSGAALRSLICTVLVEATRQMLAPPVEPQEFVSAAIDYLRKNLNEPVRMSDLIRHVGFSRSRMFDMFKAQTGLTPNDFLQRLRVERAQEQLAQTKLSVTEIALANGFSSGQYFSTVFGRYTGLSPTLFRKRNRARARLLQDHER